MARLASAVVTCSCSRACAVGLLACLHHTRPHRPGHPLRVCAPACISSSLCRLFPSLLCSATFSMHEHVYMTVCVIRLIDSPAKTNRKAKVLREAITLARQAKDEGAVLRLGLQLKVVLSSET